MIVYVQNKLINGQTPCPGSSMTLNAFVNSNYNGVGISCNGASDGEVCVTVNGGVGPFDYNWIGGPNTSCWSGVGNGTYTIIVTDLNDGSICAATVPLVGPAELVVVFFDITNPTCNGSCDGSGTAFLSGATGLANYTWGNGEVGLVANSLCTGVNQLNVTDANGCSFDTICAEVPADLISCAPAPGFNSTL